MRLKLSVRRGGTTTDLMITADATATIGDVATTLVSADPARVETAGAPDAQQYSLRVADAGGSQMRELDPEVAIGEAGLRSGAVVDIAARSGHFEAPGSDRGPAAAVLRVLEGPQAGQEFPLPFGASIIGRDRHVDVRLADGLVSKRHARINVGESIEIIDLNSANGVVIGGVQVARAALTSADHVVLGESSICVIPLQTTPPAPAGAAVVDHIRSPRVVPQYPGEDFPAPTPPRGPQRQRFPYLALISPLILGGVMFALTGQLLSVIMMAMSPVLLIGGYIDFQLGARQTAKSERRRFDAAMLKLQERLEQARDEERRARRLEVPGTGDMANAAHRLGPLLWCERPESPNFLAVNLGLGRAASRNRVVLPQSNETSPESWDQLLQLRAEFATIDQVPIVAQLRSSGALGFAGPREARDAIACGAVFQLLARHSPAELVVAAMVAPTSRSAWNWLKWMPHATSAHSPIEVQLLTDSPGTAAALLTDLEGLVEARLEGASRPVPAPRGPVDPRKPEELAHPGIPAVLLVVEHDAQVDRGRLTRLAERGADASVHVVWCAPSVERLPGVCRSHLAVDHTESGAIVGQVRLGVRTMPVESERLDPRETERLARGLSPVSDVGAPIDDDSDLPREISYAALAGLELLDQSEHVVERWRENSSLIVRDGSPARAGKEGNLRALVGHAGAEPFYLDLRRDGPHALVGGTTGSGKSEFLQSWVLGMAAANSPDRLTFLFVDYKGGSAFADCVKLPHFVGLVTDLSPHLVRRALASLRAELRYRERLFQRKRVKDLVELERKGDSECPPSLVIVVDEFAALVQEVPEFVDGVVDVAQRGRSLGLHLILATQRPAGVIKDNLRANTNLRIALRMSDADDSTDILGAPLAAHFDPAIPGRGAVRTGPGRLRSFQSGYAGGRTTVIAPPPRIDVRELAFGAASVWETPEMDQAEEASESGPTDIARIVRTISTAAAGAGVPSPRRPWLDTLAPVYDLKRLPNPRTDERIPLGVMDDPEAQDQPSVFYEPDIDGNMAIFGTGGSGKSTALRTIAAAAAVTTRGGPAHVYGLDFGAGGLRMLESLPHVAAIVSGDDDERVVRVLRRLRDVVDERAARYAAVRAGTIVDYRKLAGAPDEPRIFLLIDGIGAFREQYEFGSSQNSGWFAAFTQIAADGRQLGVHVVMTADRANAVPTSIATTVQRRIVLRLASEDEYLLLGVPKDILGASSPPGRGVLDGNELQLAVLGESANLALQSRELQRLAASLGRGGVHRPEPIGKLPEQIALDLLPEAIDGRAVIGVDDVSLGPASLELRGPFMLSGPPSSGRTTALATLAKAARRSDPAAVTVLLSPRPSSLVQLGPWTASADGARGVAELSAQLADRLELLGENGPRTAIFIENVTEFQGGEAEPALNRLVKAAVRGGHFVVGEAEISTWSQAWSIAGPFKAGRRGLLLAPGDLDGELLGAPLGRLRRSDFPPGRGFLIAKGRATRLHVAEP
ncbi:FtsK/SpoIIIE domain-containing protein [Sinomonas sp. JGH33]|uniref:FtsK/SpoIIIE domain-containing protein n=1 Tax=Sinomonas terricola TaxID=3110330 RepID=A0ABU5T9Q5_9MICC|nr:FtsK/SpoIIIE domain-containing protein [Sinomonas sp. JGH33]MEA5456397.1 FtsK/SpoIIIE domain-containing protein [Sinomonas sp. JGH33]